MPQIVFNAKWAQANFDVCFVVCLFRVWQKICMQKISLNFDFFFFYVKSFQIDEDKLETDACFDAVW